MACTNGTITKIESINIDSSTAESIRLDQLSKNIEICSLSISDSVYWGNIDHIKSSGELLFLHDQFQTKTITIFTSEGKYITQLNKKGRGPGEYNGIDAFTYNEKSKQLTIYDRGAKLMTYSFPELQYVESFKCQDYFMNIEIINDKLLVVGENKKSENEYFGLEFYDFENNRFENLNLPNQPASIELSYPNTLIKQNEKIFYASPGFKTKLFEIDTEDINQLYTIDFGKNKISEEYWQQSNARDFESALDKKKCATWVQHLRFNQSILSFYYMYENVENYYFAKYNINTKQSKVYSDIYIQEGYKPIDKPLGVFGDYHLFILYPESMDEYIAIDETEAKNEWQLKLIQLSKGTDPVLVKIKL